jgi:hypothetical protein
LFDEADGDIVQSGIAVRGIIVQAARTTFACQVKSFPIFRNLQLYPRLLSRSLNEGRFVIVTMRWARDAMEALGAQDERARRRTAKPCGSDASTLASSLVEVSLRRR